jgi:3-oxoadipate enol-lactonase
MIAFQQTRWFSDGFRSANPKIVDHFAEVFLKSDLPAYAATCDMLGAFDLRSEIGAIAVPTEILVGEEDYATPPEMARELHAAIPGSNLTIVAGARHLTPIQIPDRVAAIIRAVIAKAQKGDGVANRG